MPYFPSTSASYLPLAGGTTTGAINVTSPSPSNIGRQVSFQNLNDTGNNKWGWYVGGQGNYEGWVKFGTTDRLDIGNAWALACYVNGATYVTVIGGSLACNDYRSTVLGTGEQPILAWDNPTSANYSGRLNLGFSYPWGDSSVRNWIRGGGAFTVRRNGYNGPTIPGTGELYPPADLFKINADTYGNAALGLDLAPETGTTGARLKVDGKIDFLYDDASGTPGAATINKAKGFVSVASGASSVVVTNNLVAAGSLVIPVLMDVTDAVSIKGVVVSAGSFTIHLTGVTTGARKVGFLVH